MYRRLIYFGLAVHTAFSRVGRCRWQYLAGHRYPRRINSVRLRQRPMRWPMNGSNGGSHGDDLIPIPVSNSPGQVTLFGTDDEVMGPDPPQPNRQSQPAFKGGTASDIVDGSGYVTAPAYFDDDFRGGAGQSDTAGTPDGSASAAGRTRRRFADPACHLPAVPHRWLARL